MGMWMQAARTAMVINFVAVSGTLGQTLLFEDFETGNNSGWECTGGSQVVTSGGNPGAYLGVPYGDWYWMDLWTTEVGNPATGDLTRHGGPLEFSVDIRVFQLNNWFNEPMNPEWFPVVIQFIDDSGPHPVSVYYTAGGMPQVAQGWVRYTFEVPDPTQTDLPPGWGGTGDEDPVTYEPILPAGRTYRSVMENVSAVRITTEVPGYMYVPSWWEVGYDNLEIAVQGPGPCYADCDSNGMLNVDDFMCFINEFANAQSLPVQQQIGHYANCDGSTAAPILTVDDFMCFINEFSQGCP